jgi:hypothetical protein
MQGTEPTLIAGSSDSLTYLLRGIALASAAAWSWLVFLYFRTMHTDLSGALHDAPGILAIALLPAAIVVLCVLPRGTLTLRLAPSGWCCRLPMPRASSFVTLAGILLVAALAAHVVASVEEARFKTEASAQNQPFVRRERWCPVGSNYLLAIRGADGVPVLHAGD